MRDYLGFLATPTLWKGTAYGLTQFEFPNVDIGSFNPEPIAEHLRLGHRVEQLFSQLISASDQYHIIDQNIAVKRQKQTLGELDFLLQHSSGESYLHIELSYKFYIVSQASGPVDARLIGPNRRDAFLEKIKKTKEKQLPLLHTDEGAEIVSRFGRSPEDFSQYCYFCAQLFVPFANRGIDMHPFAKEHIRGYWLGWSDFNASYFSSYRYYIPDKREWIQDPYDTPLWYTHAQIKDQVAILLSQKRAPLIWIKKTAQTFEKCFVVWW